MTSKQPNLVSPLCACPYLNHTLFSFVVHLKPFSSLSITFLSLSILFLLAYLLHCWATICLIFRFVNTTVCFFFAFCIFDLLWVLMSKIALAVIISACLYCFYSTILFVYFCCTVYCCNIVCLSFIFIVWRHVWKFALKASAL